MCRSARAIHVNVWILLRWRFRTKAWKQKPSTGLNEEIKSATWAAFLHRFHTCDLTKLNQVAVIHSSTCFLSMQIRLIWNDFTKVSVTEKLLPVKHLQSSVMVNRTVQSTKTRDTLHHEAVNHSDITHRRSLIPPSTAVNQSRHLHLRNRVMRHLNKIALIPRNLKTTAFHCFHSNQHRSEIRYLTQDPKKSICFGNNWE